MVILGHFFSTQIWHLSTVSAGVTDDTLGKTVPILELLFKTYNIPMLKINNLLVNTSITLKTKGGYTMVHGKQQLRTMYDTSFKYRNTDCYL